MGTTPKMVEDMGNNSRNLYKKRFPLRKELQSEHQVYKTFINCDRTYVEQGAQRCVVRKEMKKPILVKTITREERSKEGRRSQTKKEEKGAQMKKGLKVILQSWCRHK